MDDRTKEHTKSVCPSHNLLYEIINYEESIMMDNTNNKAKNHI